MVGFSRFIRSCYTSYRFKVWKCAGISQSPIPAKLNTGTGLKKFSKYLGILAVSGFCFGMILTPPLACKKPKGKRHGDKKNPPAKKEKTDDDTGDYSESVKWVLEAISEDKFLATCRNEKKDVHDLLDSFSPEDDGYLREDGTNLKRTKNFRLDYQKSYRSKSYSSDKYTDFAVIHVQKNIKYRYFPTTVAAVHVELREGKEVIEKIFVTDGLKLSLDKNKICFLYYVGEP